MPGLHPRCMRLTITEPGKAAPVWFVYLLRCADGSLYCGITTQPERRLAEHNGALPGGARYTRSRRPVEMVWSESHACRADATRRETHLKKLGRRAKMSLIDQP